SVGLLRLEEQDLRPALHVFSGRGPLSAIALFALVAAPSLSQSVTVGFGNNRLTSLIYGGNEYLSDGTFAVGRVMLVDSLGNHFDGNVNGGASSPAPNTLRLDYNWGSLVVLYAPSGNRLNLTITATNTSGQTIEG